MAEVWQLQLTFTVMYVFNDNSSAVLLQGLCSSPLWQGTPTKVLVMVHNYTVA